MEAGEVRGGWGNITATSESIHEFIPASDLAKQDLQSIKCLAFLHQQVVWPRR